MQREMQFVSQRSREKMRDMEKDGRLSCVQYRTDVIICQAVLGKLAYNRQNRNDTAYEKCKLNRRDAENAEN